MTVPVSALIEPKRLGIPFAIELLSPLKQRHWRRSTAAQPPRHRPRSFRRSNQTWLIGFHRTGSGRPPVWSSPLSQLSAGANVCRRADPWPKKRVPMLRAPRVSHSTHDSHSWERSFKICSLLYKAIGRNTHDGSTELRLGFQTLMRKSRDQHPSRYCLLLLTVAAAGDQLAAFLML